MSRLTWVAAVVVIIALPTRCATGVDCSRASKYASIAS